MKKIILYFLMLTIVSSFSFFGLPYDQSIGKIFIESNHNGLITVQSASQEPITEDVIRNAHIMAIEIEANFETINTFDKHEIKMYFKSLNESFVETHLNAYTSYYASMFTPYIFASFDDLSASEIYDYALTLETLDMVKRIHIYDESIYEPKDIDDITTNAFFFDDFDDGGGGGTGDLRQIYYDFFPNGTSYTGDGITIGIIDSGTLLVDHDNFSRNQPTIVYDNYTGGNEHPTIVASVLGGKYGIAPNADIVYTDLKSTGKKMEEMIEEIVFQSDIVNMSLAVDGEFSDGVVNTVHEAFYNDLIINSNVPIVASTGNRADVYEGKHIAMPALAANVIAVGSIDDAFKPAYDTNFENANQISNKPNIVAVGEQRVIPGLGVYRGTSLSAPAVTGALALKFEKDGLLKPQQVLAMLSVTANDDVINKSDETLNMGTYDPDNDLIYNATDRTVSNQLKDNGYRERTGAGALDINALLDFCIDNFYNDNINSNTPNYIELGQFYVSTNQHVVVSIAWLHKTHNIWDWLELGFVPELSELADFDLSVWGPSGELILQCLAGNNNAEMARFTAVNSGNYTVKITPYANYDGIQYIDFAYIVR